VRLWKGWASAPPLQGVSDHSSVPRRAVAAATGRMLRGAAGMPGILARGGQQRGRKLG